MKFKDITGQEEIKSMLKRGVDEARVSHAQLFSGSSGSGTLALALAYVQYLNCTDRQGGDSCGVCPACVKTAGLVHPDIHFIFPTNTPKGAGGSQKPSSDNFLPEWRKLVASSGGYFDEQMWYDAIGLDDKQGNIAKREADEIIRKLSFKAFESKYKAVIIWLPEKMGEEAANSLLKILEEPWDNTLFLLVSAAPERLLPTILSRVQQTAVPMIDARSLADYAVSEYGVDPERAAQAARLANGDLLELRKLLSVDFDENVRENFEYFTQLMRYSYNDRHLELLTWAENMASIGREGQKRFLEYSTGLLRESYMLSAGMENISYLWGGEKDFCDKFAPFIGNHNIEELVRENQAAMGHIIQNGNPKMIFTHYALSVSKLVGAKR